MKIFLDVGHGGNDPGACNGNLIEKDMNLVCAKAAKEVLTSNGMEVKMSREGDAYLSLTQRANMANAWGADLFVSCHFNAGGGNYGAVIHSVGGGKSKELAEKIADKLSSSGQETVKVFSKKATNGNGDYYTVIAKTKMPAVIVEPCFIDTKDRELADTMSEQKALGVLIAEGVLDHIGIKKHKVQELTSINDIVWEYVHRGIVEDADGMEKEMRYNLSGRLYWLARKTLQYMRERNI